MKNDDNRFRLQNLPPLDNMLLINTDGTRVYMFIYKTRQPAWHITKFITTWIYRVLSYCQGSQMRSNQKQKVTCCKTHLGGLLMYNEIFLRGRHFQFSHGRFAWGQVCGWICSKTVKAPQLSNVNSNYISHYEVRWRFPIFFPSLLDFEFFKSLWTVHE